MSGGFPNIGDLCNGNSIGSVASGPAGTTVTPSATANTKGSWTQLIAATAADAVALVINIFQFNVTATPFGLAIDIGIGASGSETVIVPNISNWASTNFTMIEIQLALPIAIPKGTRISARCQADQASGNACQIVLQTYDGGFTQSEGAAGVDAIGFNASTTAGTAVTAGNSAKGSYAQITAATTRDYIGLFAIIDCNGVASPPDNFALVDIAIGASGSEQIIIPDAFCDPFNQYPVVMPFTAVNIPAGTRLACRINSATGTYNVTIYGVYQ